MAYRTTEIAVQKIIETDNDIDLDPFIEVANQLVTDKCGSAGYTDSKLELIERWLSAHFYSIRDPQSDDEKAGSVSVSYFGKVDLNLAQTRYGQQAMIIDTAGGLAEWNTDVTDGRRTTTASAKWLGKSDWGVSGT